MFRNIIAFIAIVLMTVFAVPSLAQSQSSIPDTSGELTDIDAAAGDIFSEEFGSTDTSDSDLADPDSSTIAEDTDTSATTTTTTTVTPSTTTLEDTPTGPLTVLVFWMTVAISFGLLQCLIYFKRRSASI